MLFRAGTAFLALSLALAQGSIAQNGAQDLAVRDAKVDGEHFGLNGRDGQVKAAVVARWPGVWLRTQPYL